MPLRKNVWLMYAISFFQGMLFYASISTLYRAAYGVTIFQITIIESICMALTMAFEVPWGVAAERMGYKKVMVLCTFMLFGSKYIFYIASGFGLFLLERIVLAVVYSGLSGVDTSIIYLSAGEEHSQKAFGVNSALNSAGLLIATAIFALLPEGSYRLAALLTMFTYGIAAILTLFLTEVKQQPEKRESPIATIIQATRALRGMPRMIPLLVMSVVFFEITANLTGFFSQLQYVRGGATSRVLSVALIIASVCEMSGAFSARLTRLLGERRFGLSIIGLCALGCIVMAFVENIAVSIGVIAFMAAAAALLGPLTGAMENRMITSDDRATALSVNSMLTSILAVPINLGLGYMADVSLPASFIICGGMLFTAGILFHKLTRS